jgi:site-specific recombinase XerC
MKQIQIWLGHSTLSTTAVIYSHLDFHVQIETGLVMDGMFERNRVTEPTGLAAGN